MDSDDILKGRILNRREILGLFGAAGAALLTAGLAACSGDDEPLSTSGTPGGTPASPSGNVGGGTGNVAAGATSTPLPSCVVPPELTEGPYFVDEMLDRSDIRSDPGSGRVVEGVELRLTLNVSSVAGGTCSAMPGAMVDIWQCDALGAYSGVRDPISGTTYINQKFLRGFQNTDVNGQVKFTTIYPGWYPGRATHIHFKIRKGNEEFTSQFFFDDSLSDTINTTLAPYSQKGSNGRTLNSRDGIFRDSQGMLQLDAQKSGNIYTATFDIGIQS